MKPYDMLKEDHKRVSELLRKLENTTDRGKKTRERLFGELKNELDVHTRIEEDIFYPALRDNEKTQDITLEAYEEHNIVKNLLQEMDQLPKDDETWTAKLSVLKENVEHHVDEEEGEMFSKAKKILNEEQELELGRRMENKKEELMAQLHKL